MEQATTTMTTSAMPPAAPTATAGSEMFIPDWWRMTEANFILPCIAYFIMFHLIGAFVRRYCWTQATGFK